jgi:predicted PurR-regulated permease PerM
MKRPAAEKKRPPAHVDHERLTRVSTPTTIAVLAALTLFLFVIRAVLLPFVLAGIIAYVCTPLIELMQAKLRMPRALAALIVFAVLAALALLLGWLGGPPLIDEVTRVITDLHGTLQAIAERIIGDRSVELMGRSMNAAQIADAAVTGLREWVGEAGRILTLATLSFAAMFGFFLSWVLLMYFLIGGPVIARGLFWLMPPRQRPITHEIWGRLDPILKRYFIGVAIVVTYASIAAYIGLGLILGIHHAIFLAMLTGLLEMLPVIGPGASAVIAGLVAVHQATGVGSILGYVVYATLLRLSIDQMIGPLVLGRAGRVHPVLVIFCFLTGGLLFGVAGVILAVPVALAIKVILATLYEEPLVDASEA